MKEITWYGRGGQGAFTASRILGAAAMLKGYKSLAFPSFGPERRGAPIRAFTKISREPVTDRSIIEKSDYAIVLDDTLFGEEILNSLKPEGLLLINTQGGKELPADERISSRIFCSAFIIFSVSLSLMALMARENFEFGYCM